MSGAGLLLQRFLQGQPRTLGALLLVIGLLQVAFGVIFTISPCVRRDELATHFYPAVLLILAGILSLAADKAKNLALVKACLVIYAICAVVVAVVNIFYLIDLVYAPNLRNIRRPITDAYSQSLHKVSHYCTGMRGIVLVLTSLGFFICISMAAFGCKAVCRKTGDDEVPVTVSGDFQPSTETSRENQPESVAAGPESSAPEGTLT